MQLLPRHTNNKTTKTNNGNTKGGRKRKIITNLTQRIDYDVTEIDTGTLQGGIIENPFKDKVVIPKELIEGDIECYFGNIHFHISDLLERIYNKYGHQNVYMLGCIAWLSDPGLIGILSKAAGVQILINDEDLSKFAGGKTKALYDSLPIIKTPYKTIFANCPNKILRYLGIDEKPVDRADGYFNPIRKKTAPIGQYYAAIRSIGSRAIEILSPDNPIIIDEPEPTSEPHHKGKPIFQSGRILHSKFVIPCVWNGPGTRFRALGVLNGSMNWTQKSKLNQENVVWTPSEAMGNGFLNDYTRSFQVSSPVRQ